MGQGLWLLKGSTDPLRQSSIRSRSSPRRISELTARMKRLEQRLRQFQQRYKTQLSHADQMWLYQVQQQVAFYLAELSQPGYMQDLAPEDVQAVQAASRGGEDSGASNEVVGRRSVASHPAGAGPLRQPQR